MKGNQLCLHRPGAHHLEAMNAGKIFDLPFSAAAKRRLAFKDSSILRIVKLAILRPPCLEKFSIIAINAIIAVKLDLMLSRSRVRH